MLSTNRNAYMRKWRDENRQHCNEYMRLWRELHKDEQAEYYRIHRREHKKTYKARQLNRRYGLSISDVSELLKDQKGKCGICGRKLSLVTACVDHCHKTKAIRGCLCKVCNSGLGFFKDKQALLKKALSYLVKYAH